MSKRSKLSGLREPSARGPRRTILATNAQRLDSALSLAPTVMFTVTLVATATVALPTTLGYDMISNYTEASLLTACLLLPGVFGICRYGGTAKRSDPILPHIAFVAVSVIVHHLIFVLFGAPLVSGALDTLQAAAILSSITIGPLSAVIGADPHRWVHAILVSRKHTVAEVWVCLAAVAAWLGTWAGAIVIPLDWDVPYQRWPIPCTVGGVVGFTGMSVLYLVLAAVRGSRDQS